MSKWDDIRYLHKHGQFQNGRPAWAKEQDAIFQGHAPDSALLECAAIEEIDSLSARLAELVAAAEAAAKGNHHELCPWHNDRECDCGHKDEYENLLAAIAAAKETLP